VKAVRVERRDAPVEAGVPVTFEAESSRTWNFGDGSAAVQGRLVRHAFERPGRYVVRGNEGDSLRDEIALVVAPRPVSHQVPPDAQWAVLVAQAGGLAQLTDAAEQLAGATLVQRWLEMHPVAAWASEARGTGSPLLDPAEAFAIWAWPDHPDALITTVDVTGPEAMRALEEWLLAHEWQRVSTVQGLGRFEQEDRALDLFFDRGALYAVESPLTRRVASAQQRIAAAPAQGLTLDPEVAAALDALPTGTVQTWLRAGKGLPYRSIAGAVRFTNDSATWEGRIAAPLPLWADGLAASTRLVRTAPESPSVLLSVSAPVDGVAKAWPGFPELSAETPEVLAGLAGLGQPLDLLVYPDVPGFIRSTLAGDGLPKPRGVVLLEVPVRAPGAVAIMLRALFTRWEWALTEKNVGQNVQWSGSVGGQPLEITLTPTGLFVRSGRPDDRAVVDLTTGRTSRFEPGHLALEVDVGALRRELLRPHRLEGIDPRRSLSTQAAAATVIDRLTSLELATLDLRPDLHGAQFELTLRFRLRD
jgi:hypothetical protein